MRSLLIAFALLGLAGIGALATSSCGCAPPGETLTPIEPGAARLPEGFELSAPWEPGKTHRIIRGYQVRGHKGVDRPSRSNDAYALDFDLEQGEPVLAVADGKGIYSGPASGGWASYGNVVLLQHREGISSLYAHLDETDVRTGQTVARGERVGTAGGSGGFRPHPHFALYRDVRLAKSDRGTGPYGGTSVLPEPFGPDDRVGLAVGQCIETR